MERTHRGFLFLSGLLVSGLGVLGSACGGGGSTPDAALSDSAIGQEAAGPPQPYCTGKSAAAGATDLSGTWVARVTGAEVVNAPIVGVMHNQTLLYMLFNIVQQGAYLTADGRYCDRVQVNEPTAVAPVVIPTAWAHTETPVYRTGTFAIGGEGFPVMTFAELSEAIGWTLAPPTDTPPTTATDSRVIDQDNDGHPGITVVLSGQSLAGSIYSVQLQTTSISAIVVAPDRVEGALTFTTQQNVLGSDPDTLAQLYALGTSGADPVVCNSGFVMVKLPPPPPAADGGALSCDWVRANEAVLFP